MTAAADTLFNPDTHTAPPARRHPCRRGPACPPAGPCHQCGHPMRCTTCGNTATLLQEGPWLCPHRPACPGVMASEAGA